MSRTYSTETLIILPRLSGGTANVLITRLITAAKEAAVGGQPLPDNVCHALERLTTTNQTLSSALQPVTTTPDNAAGQEADNALDRAWGNLHRILSAWANSDPADNPDPVGTDRLMCLFFSDGLTFLKLRYDLQWQASQGRLDAFAADPANTATAGALGLQTFVSRVQQAQADYGLALGITQVLESEETAKVRTALTPALGALRSYVLQVVAYADSSAAGTLQQTDALLEPLTSWTYPESSKKTTEAPAPT